MDASAAPLQRVTAANARFLIKFAGGRAEAVDFDAGKED
jgi:hypothetical protein